MTTKQEAINIAEEDETLENDRKNWPRGTGEKGDLPTVNNTLEPSNIIQHRLTCRNENIKIQPHKKKTKKLINTHTQRSND